MFPRREYSVLRNAAIFPSSVSAPLSGQAQANEFVYYTYATCQSTFSRFSRSVLRVKEITHRMGNYPSHTRANYFKSFVDLAGLRLLQEFPLHLEQIFPDRTRERISSKV